MSRSLPHTDAELAAVARRPRGARRLVVASLAALAVVTATLAPPALADELDDQRDRVSQQLSQSREDLDGYNAELTKAAQTLADSRARLAAAQSALDSARQDLADARAADAAKASQLQHSRAELARATKRVADNEAALVAEHNTIKAVVSRTVQQQPPMMGVAAFLTNMNTGDMNARVQWSNAMLAGGQQALDELEARKVALTRAREQVRRTEERIAAEKKDAEEHLAQTRQAESAASQAEKAMAAAVSANEAARKDADAKVAAEKARQAKLEAQEADLDQRIKARVEAARKAAAEAARRARAEAARKAAAARAQAEREAARKAAAQSRKSSSSSSSTSSGGSGSSGSSGSSGNDSSSSSSSGGHSASSYFDFPVDAPITSPYGMRFHPVLHVWKLHDGTDFGAACGTAIRAPRDGKVVEKYWNDAYGNRLMIDHGLVGGHYVTTGYNHAIRYTVSVGQHVSRGQVIGYVGTTGWSTGCHLHLMTWTDGNKTNPMARWF